MKKMVYILSGTVLGLLLLWGIIFLFSDRSIKHYNQLTLECEGQIFFQPNQEINFPVYFYDEEKLSEMANPENFKKVKVLLSNGEEIVASNCTVEDLSNAAGIDNQYFYKKVDISFKYEKECEIVGCSFVYSDKEESFNLGKIKVRQLIPGDHLNSVNFFGELISLQNEEESSGLENRVNDTLVVTIFNATSDMTLTKIDLGLDNMAVELCKMKCLNSPEFDYSKVRGIDGFGEAKTLDQIDTSPAEVMIKNSEGCVYAAPIGVSQEYYENPKNYYINPLYCYTDSDGNKYEWAIDYDVDVISPYIGTKESVDIINNKLKNEGI